MVRLKSDLLAALVATGGRGLDKFDLRWSDEAAPPSSWRPTATPVRRSSAARSKGSTRQARWKGVEIFHAGTRREGNRFFANGGPRSLGHGAGA